MENTDLQLQLLEAVFANLSVHQVLEQLRSKPLAAEGYRTAEGPPAKPGCHKLNKEKNGKNRRV